MYACLVLLNSIVVSLRMSSAFLVALSIAAVLAACSLVTDSNKILDIVKLKNSNSVSIHIRTRGHYGYAYKDFRKKQKISIIDQVNYIKKSILFIRSNVNNPKFFIWSDDVNLIKKFFNKSSFEFINTNDDIHDFYLFNFCKHFIVSPSSYHWMGAWLNKNRDKICIRPSYMTPSNNIDFWPSNWIKI